MAGPDCIIQVIVMKIKKACHDDKIIKTIVSAYAIHLVTLHSLAA